MLTPLLHRAANTCKRTGAVSTITLKVKRVQTTVDNIKYDGDVSVVLKNRNVTTLIISFEIFLIHKVFPCYVPLTSSFYVTVIGEALQPTNHRAPGRPIRKQVAFSSCLAEEIIIG